MLYARFTTTPLSPPQWMSTARLIEDSLAMAHASQNEWTPAVDIRETDTALTFTAELPGIRLEDVEVTADEGVLTIQGTKTEALKEGEQGRYHLSERAYGPFLRRFQLPQGIDGDKIEADVADGMLNVRIPKAALPKPNRIRIQAGVIARQLGPQVLDNGESGKDSSKPAIGALAPV